MPEQCADFMVAAGKHNADAPAGEVFMIGQDGGQRYGAGGLDNLL